MLDIPIENCNLRCWTVMIRQEGASQRMELAGINEQHPNGIFVISKKQEETER